jgi:hypothetical protein
VILSIHRLLNVWLVEALPIDDQIVLILLDTHALVLIEQFVLLMDLKTVVALV